jgi:hypothetical protein
MPYTATTFNIMIVSPSDVAAERAAIRQTLTDWNVIHSESRRIVLLPIGWETHGSPKMGQHPQKVLNEQVASRADLLVGVFWTRIGTPTPTHQSGSVEEIEEHIAAGKPVMLYFSNQPVRLDSVDGDQYTKLLAFRATCKGRGLLDEYSDVGEFREKFFRQLQLKLNHDTFFAVTAPEDSVAELSAPSIELSNEAKALLVAAAVDDGVVMRLLHLGGTDVQAGGRNFVESNDRRNAARWEAAVDELSDEGLVEDKTGKGEVYFMTHEGFRIADTLPR